MSNRTPGWQVRLGEAASAADSDVDVEAFMAAAWSAFVATRPGLVDHLAERQLRDQLEELRRNGRIATA